jgi:hypothetical protein
LANKSSFFERGPVHAIKGQRRGVLRLLGNETNKERHIAYNKTSRLEKPKVLQLNHKNEKPLFFDCAAAICTMQNALLVISFYLAFLHHD